MCKINDDRRKAKIEATYLDWNLVISQKKAFYCLTKDEAEIPL